MLSGLPPTPFYPANAALFASTPSTAPPPPDTMTGPLHDYGVGYSADKPGRRTAQDVPRESGIVYTGPGALPESPSTSPLDKGFARGSGSSDDRYQGHKYVARPAWRRGRRGRTKLSW